MKIQAIASTAANFSPAFAHQLGSKGYAVIDQFLNLSEVTALLHTLSDHKEDGNMKRAGIGNKGAFQLRESIRGDFIRWIDKETAAPATQRYLDKLETLKNAINELCYLGIKDYEVHYTFYPEGTFYKRHIDNFQKIGNRVLSFICYLNINWQPGDGGELRIYKKDENGNESFIDVAPTAGKLVLLLSEETEHEVLMANKPRYSLTGWMLRQPKGLGFL